MAGVWSAEQTSALIDLYQVEPILYTTSDPSYHNKFKRQSALEGIVEGLKEVRPNSSVNEIKAKINGLRARFSSEMARSRNKPSGSGSEVCNSSFAHFEKLLFLQDHLAARKGFCNTASTNAPRTNLSSTLGEDEIISNATDNMEEADSEVLLSPMLVDIPTPLASPATSEGIQSEEIGRNRKKERGKEKQPK